MSREPQEFPEDPRATLREKGLRPQKSRGQNFLVDHHWQLRVVEACEVEAGEQVLEIGPGLGALTHHLLARGARVTALELDHGVAAALREKHPPGGALEIREEDAVKHDFAATAEEFGGAIPVLGNIPYAIQSPLLYRLVQNRESVSRIVFLMQLEVAQKLVAAPGSNAYGALSVLVQMYFAPQIVARVPPGAFSPRPKVMSAIARLRIRHGHRPLHPFDADYACFERVVKAAFSQRRKTLRNSLGTLALGSAGTLGKDGAERALQAAGIDARRRAETLGLDEFARLTDAVAEL